MSFILEALKRSENERQRQMGPSLADVRARPRPSQKPWWAIGVGALLVVNLAVLLIVLMRDPPPPATDISTSAQPAAPTSAGPSQPALEVTSAPAPLAAAPAATSPAVRSLADEAATEAFVDPAIANPDLAAAAAIPEGPSIVRPIEGPSVAASSPQVTMAPRESLPTLDEVIARGVQLPDLHLDIHVHSNNPAERFVFVNMRKYVEGQTLSEGPTLERITPEGAVLAHAGTRFLVRKP